MEQDIKRTLLVSSLALALAAPAFAQSTTVTTGSTPSASVTIAPEYRTKIKTYVKERNVRSVTVRERITVGATLPADIELMDVPDDWGPEITRYRYVYSGDDVVLVEPSSRRVVHVID